ncbi:MAG: hypothetical protein RI988_1344 [Pseudomonadota bacterium]|jgi:hypothetical protein
MSTAAEPAQASPAALRPDELLPRLWGELQRAVRTRGHGWRCPVLASVDAEGHPRARTVVLRAVDAQRGELLVFTHGLSAKVPQLRADPRAQFVFWCDALQWQLRASVQVRIEVDGPRVEAARARVAGTPAARDYLGPGGEALHLAVLVAQVHEFDWLELDPRGHRGLRLAPVDARGPQA